MLKGIHTSASGMIPRVRKQEMTANNLANATTPGYKRDMMFTKELSRAQQKQLPRQSDWQQPMVDRTYVDYESGVFDKTGNPLDLAIDGDGFFQVQDDQGNQFLTRSGHFEVSDEGIITFAGRFQLVGQGGPIQVGSGDIAIGDNGEIQVNGNTVDRVVSRNVADYSVLEKIGSTMFAVPEGEPILPAIDATIRQGYLESANVNIVEEMVDMMISYREYEANAKAIQSQDQSLDNLFRRVAGNQ